MSFLIKEYEIPLLGKVELIESSGYDKSFNGNYYAKNEKLGEFVKKCSSVDELIRKTNNEVSKYFNLRRRVLVKEINNKSEELDESGYLESVFHNSLNENPESLENFMKKYQTSNPLQMEYQEAEKHHNNF